MGEMGVREGRDIEGECGDEYWYFDPMINGKTR